jgi:hypothetical protein
MSKMKDVARAAGNYSPACLIAAAVFILASVRLKSRVLSSSLARALAPPIASYFDGQLHLYLKVSHYLS